MAGSWPRDGRFEKEASQAKDHVLFVKRTCFPRARESTRGRSVACFESRSSPFRLSGMAEDARKTLWWPFTQHANISNDLVTILDSRCGDDFAVYCPAKDGDAAQTGRIEAQYDACASWWTQVRHGTSHHDLKPCFDACLTE